MFQEDTEVVDSAETTTEDLGDNNSQDENSDSEDEGEKEVKSDDKPKESPEQRRARIKRQYEREFGKQDKEDGKESSKEVGSDEKYNRLSLKYEGYTDKAEQDVILEYAAWKGIEVDEAIKSSVIQAEIKALRDKKSTPSPSVRTGKGGAPSVDALVARYKAGKYLSIDEMKQVRKKLR